MSGYRKIGPEFQCVDEYGMTKAQTITFWAPIITDDHQPGFRVERDGDVRYIFLNPSSNEPTVFVYLGKEPTVHDGDTRPLHFYDLESEF